MARFDVYHLAGRGEVSFVLDVQVDSLEALGTRIVVPLLPKEAAPKPAKRLTPIFVINSESFVMMMQFMAAIPQRELKQVETSLVVCSDDITQALDLLLTGF